MDYFGIQDLGLNRDVWQPFALCAPAVHYNRGQMIYLQGNSAEYFYYLKSGRVKTFTSSENGEERVLTIYQQGNLFGAAAFFDGFPRMSSAVAASECDVVRISPAIAGQEISRNPQLALALMKYLARTVRLLSDHVEDMAFLRTDQRIARQLLSCTADSGGAVHYTQEELAFAVSANRVTVCRILNRFQREGLIKKGYGSLRILRPEKLRAMISTVGSSDLADR